MTPFTIPPDPSIFCSDSPHPTPAGTVKLVKDDKTILQFDVPPGLQLEQLALRMLRQAGLETAGRWFISDAGVAVFESGEYTFQLTHAPYMT